MLSRVDNHFVYVHLRQAVIVDKDNDDVVIFMMNIEEDTVI